MEFRAVRFRAAGGGREAQFRSLEDGYTGVDDEWRSREYSHVGKLPSEFAVGRVVGDVEIFDVTPEMRSVGDPSVVTRKVQKRWHMPKRTIGSTIREWLSRRMMSGSST